MSISVEVRYADLGYAPGRDRLRFGDTVKVIPVDHPEELCNQNWISVGPITHIWQGKSGPKFKASNIVWIPFDEDEPLRPGKRTSGQTLSIKAIMSEVLK